jgi:hypothetical protein
MSTILVDNLTGKTSAGSITVTSEGGAATMQLQQGLAKQWWNVDNIPSTVLLDSFNVSSMTDISTGTLGPSFVNNMSGVSYSVAVAAQTNHNGYVGTKADMTTSDYDTSFRNSSYSATDLDLNLASVHGDLA